jgi:hypothetical protein
MKITQPNTLKCSGLVTSYNPSILTGDRVISVNSSSAPVSVVISSEDVASGSTTALRWMYVTDFTGNADTNNITITLENGGLINGATSVVLSGKFASVLIALNGLQGRILS